MALFISGATKILIKWLFIAGERSTRKYAIAKKLKISVSFMIAFISTETKSIPLIAYSWIVFFFQNIYYLISKHTVKKILSKILIQSLFYFSYGQKFWQDKTKLSRLQRNKHFRDAAFVYNLAVQ